MHEFWWTLHKHPRFISLANEFSFEEKLLLAIISAHLFGAKCQHRAVCQSEKTCSVRPYIRLKLFSRRLCRALVGSPTWQKSPNLDCDQIVSSKIYINFTPGRTFRSNFCSLTVSIKFSGFYKVISTRWHTAMSFAKYLLVQTCHFVDISKDLFFALKVYILSLRPPDI